MGRLARLFGRKTTPLETATDEKHGSDSAAASTGTPLETATDEKHVSDSADASTRESVRGNLGVDAIDVMADLILVECSALGWFPTEDRGAHGPATGVCIRSKYGSIRSCPPDHPGLKGFEDAVFALNSRVAIKMRSKAVEVAVRNHIAVAPELHELFIDANTRIQILPTIHDLPLARKSQYAAFVRDEGVLCVWADSVEEIIPTASALEAALVKFLWSDEADQLNQRSLAFGGASDDGKEIASTREAALVSVDDSEDPEKSAILAARKLRPVALIAPAATGCAAAAAVILLSLGIRALLIRWIYDGNAIRFALVAVFPPIFFVVMFPASVVISSVLHLFGPVAQYHQNSANYSAIRPPRDTSMPLQPITVQMPVYKESLQDVLIPTLESVQRATTVYERQGGVINVIICDDGLQLLSEDDRARRVKYYRDHNIAYVARPPHELDGFQRRGRFKKAGNLNHCNTLSLRVEDIMTDMRPSIQSSSGGPEFWTELDERDLYETSLARALDEHEGKTWADGNIRIGEIILLIDSDTRVPEDCFMDASMEMTQSPHVAIIQHSSGIMQVAHHFFENGVAFFTRNLQIGISFTASSGDGAPFVGHNAFLRWRALQESALPDPYDGVARIWSESHVSEDFQISLRLQSLVSLCSVGAARNETAFDPTQGWTLRWATYSNNGFEEGVSLTCSDELARWQKYAYGCSEIIFNPIRYWPTRGPLTKLFRNFLGSNIPPHAKYGIMGYIFSYYALSLACTASLANFVLIGVFAISDTFYCTSWNILFVCLLLFQGVANVVMCVLRYRLKLERAGKEAFEQVKWIREKTPSTIYRAGFWALIPAAFFVIFFGGLSLPITQSFVSHLFSLDMSWTTTSKSVVKSNFFLQMPRIWKRFWFQIVVSVLVLAGLIVSTTSLVPAAYRVTNIEAIIPLALTFGFHFVWPFVLDTDITTFTF